MKFETIVRSSEHRYSLGVETESRSHFMAIPVSNQLVDYIEYYRLTDDEYTRLRDDQRRAIDFAESCRRREQDLRLFMQPGSDRGVPR